MGRKPTTEELEERIQGLEPGDHLCCIYETGEEHQTWLRPFIRQGLERDEKVIYIIDARAAEDVLNDLRDDGVETGSYLESGQLIISTVDDAYMREGIFDPDGMIAFLRDQTEQALNEGYSALRVTGEMTWALKGAPGSERLIEYEAKLNEFFPSSKCVAICQYDKRRFGPEILLDVLTTHPVAVIGTEMFDNFYYIPPKDFLGPNSSAARLNNWERSLAERKRAEEELRESEKRYRVLVEDMPAMICRFLPDGILTFVNSAYSNYFAKKKEELIGQNFFQFIPEEDQEKVRNHFMSLDQKKPMTTYEHQVFAPDGKVVWQEWTDRALFDEKNNLTEYQSIGHDITERKHAEEELKKSEEKYRTLVDEIKDGFFITDDKGAITFVNKALAEIVGYENPDEILGKSFLEFLSPEVRDGIMDKFSRAIQDRSFSELLEFPIIRKDGSISFVQLKPALVIEEDKVIGTRGVIRDVTEHKRAEQALIAREKELQVKTSNLEEANIALKVLLNKRDEDRAELEDKMLLNMKWLVLPYLEKLKKSGLNERQEAFGNILESLLNDIISPFTHKLTSQHLNLTPTEIQVANLVKEGKTTKEVAELLNSSTRAIEFHRENLRKKLGLKNKKINLRSYLLSLP